MEAFEGIVRYYPENPPYGGTALYFKDKLGRDWYDVAWSLPEGTPMLLIRPNGWICSWTFDMKNMQLTVAEDTSAYEVDPASIPEDIESWSWYYSPTRGFYQE